MIYWIWNELDRTVFTGIKFSFPARFVSPFGFLGMLTFIMIITLGVTGALLMFYYEPIMTRSWDSVAFINNDVPFGFHIRNLHYHGSNAMVMLAILHMYYQYFSGRYKIRNEVLWVTGVILGTVTILEAFTGYDIIFSERAELAISIAASLTNSIPIAGPMIRELAFGAGFHDFVLRFYAQHVFILPIVMLGLMAVHFPRFLVFDVPMVMAICGAMCLAGGVFPVDLGFKFEPTVPPGITVPEWYLTALYAFLRTQYDKFLTGVLWPALFIGILLLTPFLDRYKKFSWKDRPWITAFGITGISQILVTTYWGFYIPPDTTIPLVERLVIDPINLYLVMILLVPLSFGFTLMMIHLAKDAERKAKLAKANCTTYCHNHWHIKHQESWHVHCHQSEHDDGQNENMLCVEPKHKIMKASTKRQFTNHGPSYRNGVGKPCGNADCKLCPLTEDYIISSKGFENCYSAKYNTCYPQNFISYFVSATKVLVIHVKDG